MPRLEFELSTPNRRKNTVEESKSVEDFDSDDARHLESHAADWARWMERDLTHFIGILQARTGASRQEVLLYLISERLSQIAEQGISLTVRHEMPKPPPSEGDEWKVD